MGRGRTLGCKCSYPEEKWFKQKSHQLWVHLLLDPGPPTLLAVTPASSLVLQLCSAFLYVGFILKLGIRSIVLERWLSPTPGLIQPD